MTFCKHHFSPGSADCTIRIWECSKKRQLKVSNVFFPLVFGTAVAVVDEGRRLESFQKTGRNEWDYDKDLHHFCRKTYIPTSWSCTHQPPSCDFLSGNDRPLVNQVYRELEDEGTLKVWGNSLKLGLFYSKMVGAKHLNSDRLMLQKRGWDTDDTAIWGLW